jgi:hypothetical protein
MSVSRLVGFLLLSACAASRATGPAFVIPTRPLAAVTFDANGCPVMTPATKTDLNALLPPAPPDDYPVRVPVLSPERLLALRDALSERQPGVRVVIDTTGHVVALHAVALPCALYRDLDSEALRRAFALELAAPNLEFIGVKTMDELAFSTRVVPKGAPGADSPIFVVEFAPVWLHRMMAAWLAKRVSDDAVWRQLPAETGIEDEDCASGTSDGHAGGNGCIDRLGGKVHVTLRTVGSLRPRLVLFSYRDLLEVRFVAEFEPRYPAQVPAGLNLPAAEHPHYTLAGPYLIDLVQARDVSELRSEAPMGTLDP